MQYRQHTHFDNNFVAATIAWCTTGNQSRDIILYIILFNASRWFRNIDIRIKNLSDPPPQK